MWRRLGRPSRAGRLPPPSYPSAQSGDRRDSLAAAARRAGEEALRQRPSGGHPRRRRTRKSPGLRASQRHVPDRTGLGPFAVPDSDREGRRDGAHYGRPVPLYVMTSPATHEETVAVPGRPTIVSDCLPDDLHDLLSGHHAGRGCADGQADPGRQRLPGPGSRWPRRDARRAPGAAAALQHARRPEHRDVLLRPDRQPARCNSAIPN